MLDKIDFGQFLNYILLYVARNTDIKQPTFIRYRKEFDVQR